MITIKMHKNKWRIEIKNEEWKFESIEGLKQTMNNLINYKDFYGRINGNTN